MSLHTKPAVIIRRGIPLPPNPSSDQPSTGTGTVALIDINPQTVVTIFGTATALWEQKAKVELLEKDLTTKTTVFLDGQGRESLRESLVDPNSLKAVTWGPFDDLKKVQLTFYHKKDGDWNISTIKEGKIKLFTDEDLQSAVSLIPVDDGGHGVQDYQNIIANVSRTTLF